MYTRSDIGRLLNRTGVYDFVVRSISLFWWLWGAITKRNDRALVEYLHTHDVHKLHIGCGKNYLDSWFNTDLYPNRRSTRLNATRRFPFADNTFDFVFSEHMIEHIPYARGHVMLSECFRVLKAGGKLRIATPDLQFLLELYRDPANKLHHDYICWSSDLFIGKAAPHGAVSVVNNYFRDWGHQYIYDFQVMSKALEDIGFSDITKAAVTKSGVPDLNGLEHDQRMPDGFLELESMVLEAQKPA